MRADRRTSGGNPRGDVGHVLVGFLLAAWPLLSVPKSREPLSSSGTRRSIEVAFARSSTAGCQPFRWCSMNSTVGGAFTARRAGTRSSRSSPATTRFVQASQRASLALMAVWVIGLAALVSY